MAYHPENVEIPLGKINIEHRKNSEGGIEQIAVIPPENVALAISRMDYGSLTNFLQHLSANLDSDGESDSKRGRKLTANLLYSISMHLDDARDSAKSLWERCQKHMTKVEGGYNGK